ncbi:hypothetical protein ACFLSX_02950 [Calditrichota bacterium]
MEYFKKIVWPILLTGFWINISETLRWVFFVEPYWIEYYQNLNLTFPTGMTNNIIWMIWGFCFATAIFIFSKKFTLFQTTILSWFLAFAMLWLVLWNINILPVGFLWFVIPLSLFEAFVGSWICKKLLAG